MYVCLCIHAAHSSACNAKLFAALLAVCHVAIVGSVGVSKLRNPLEPIVQIYCIH